MLFGLLVKVFVGELWSVLRGPSSVWVRLRFKHFRSNSALNRINQQSVTDGDVVIDLVRFQSGYHAEMHFRGLVLFGLT